MAACHDNNRWQEEVELEEEAALLLGPVESAPGSSWRRPVVAVVVAAGLVTMAAVVISRSSPSTSLLHAQPVDATELWRKSNQLTGRKGSFLVIGDWGWDSEFHGNTPTPICQQTIAKRMAEVQRDLGDVKFVINVGDSFYPFGVVSKSDPQWQLKWRDVYNTTSVDIADTTSVPWYSVYGNHDMINDPCACAEDDQACVQVNANVSDLSSFYMPSLNWNKEHPELGLEVIGMDLNTIAAEECGASEWQCPKERCMEVRQKRSEQAFNLFFERAQSSTAKNLLVFSHYPTDYLQYRPDFLRALRDNSKHHIEYFGGHRHGVDQTSTVSTWPNSNWVVGGGGGYGCDGAMGFVVGEIADDLTVKTYSVLVDSAVCCPR